MHRARLRFATYSNPLGFQGTGWPPVLTSVGLPSLIGSQSSLSSRTRRNILNDWSNSVFPSRLRDPESTIVYIQFRDMVQAAKLLESFSSRRQPPVSSRRAPWRRRFSAAVLFILSLLAIVICPICLGAIFTWVCLTHFPAASAEISSLVWIGILAVLVIPYIGWSYRLGSRISSPRRR